MNSDRQLLPEAQPVPPGWGTQAETASLDIILFSKDRAAQLDALLRSLRAYFSLPHRLHVVYATSGESFELGYDRLRRWHRGVHWVNDEGLFASVFRNLLHEVGDGPGRYLMFLVDDLLFTRPFTAQALMQALDNQEDILAVSLRLGENITWNQVNDRPTRPPDFSHGYRWAWRQASPGYWNYPMSLDGHLFRTADITGLLPKLRFNTPNEFESALASQPCPRPLLVCEATPTVVNVPANRVQSQYQNPCGHQDAASLNRAFLTGQAIDVRGFAGRPFNSCHIDETLPLMPDQRDPEAGGWERIHRNGRDYLRIDLREIPTFILNCTEDRQKRRFLQEQLDELGMNHEFVSTMRITPGWVGVALGHLKVLRLTRARPPFLVLEDDCVFDQDFRAVIEVPAEADCLYLSASLFGIQHPGRISGGELGRVLWSRYDSGYLRVYNMLARHALLYLDAGFQQAVIASQVEALTNRRLAHPGDIGVAMLQPAHVALLTENSMCRQLNRDVTGGRLAELLPDNEVTDTSTISTSQQRSRPRGIQLPKPQGLGLISHQYRFIWCQIGKNASSTLRAELNKPFYACQPCVLAELDEVTLNGYFKFTFLRDPVSRLLSAYQEISWRHELQDSTVRNRPFLEMPDSPERFEAFLDQVEQDKWDRHVFTQRSLLGDIAMDFHGRVESLDAGLRAVFERLGLPPCRELPRIRSRSNRKSRHGYDRFNLDHRQLTPQQINRIRTIYREDVELLEASCPLPPLLRGSTPSSQLLALEILKTEDPAPIELYTRVNEQLDECYVCEFGSRGFFAEVSTVIRAMIYCWEQGYRLVLDSAGSSWAWEHGWADYFEPFCASLADVPAGRIAQRLEFANPNHRAARKTLFSFMPEEIAFGHQQIRGFNNIMAFFTNLVFRPTRECQEQVDRITAALDLSGPYDAIHIRRGDKIGDEDILHPASDYLRSLGLESLHGSLFVMSDDWAAVQEVQQYLHKQNAPVQVASLVPEEHRGFDLDKFRQGLPFMGQPAGTARPQPSRDHVRDQARTLIAETLVAAKSDRFVSTWRSNVGRMVWALHRNPQQCVLLQPPPGALKQAAAKRQPLQPADQAPTHPNIFYSGTLHLRGGSTYQLEIPAGSACLEPLRGLLSKGRSARAGQLFQVPLEQGRSVLSFSGTDVRFFSLTRTASPGSHHPLTNTDEGHLGGYIRSHGPRAAEFGTEHGDPATYTPALWQWAIDTLGVESVLDVGCGEGHAAAFFRDHGCTVLGIDGSEQAQRDSVIPDQHHRHDYTEGPFVPPGSWDLAWSCEFVEHVEERYMDNFLATFACARKYLMVTYASPGQPGWHHVNCQPLDYWVSAMSGIGFRLDEALTSEARAQVGKGHFRDRGLVFVRVNKTDEPAAAAPEAVA